MKNKSLQQIQEENRRAIIIACNPEAKSYEEALEKEYFGKIVNIQPNEISISGINEFNGKPLTFDRVLLAINSMRIDLSFAGYFDSYESPKFINLELGISIFAQ